MSSYVRSSKASASYYVPINCLLPKILIRANNALFITPVPTLVDLLQALQLEIIVPIGAVYERFFKAK